MLVRVDRADSKPYPIDIEIEFHFQLEIASYIAIGP
jgi:hypothetical protein